jgi:hypothetical protein
MPKRIKRTSRKINRWYLIPAIILLAFLAIKAGSLGLANLQVIKAENIFAVWDKTHKVTSVEQWQEAFDAIARSQSLHPNNPHNFTLKARLYERRGLSEFTENASEDFHRALKLHYQAAKLRPLWPYTWAEMAGLKIRLNEVDGDLAFYIERAMATGPYTDKVHEVVVAYGLARLAANPFEPVEGFKVHVLRGLQNPHTGKWVRTTIELNGREVMVCRWIGQAGEGQKDAGMCRRFQKAAN